MMAEHVLLNKITNQKRVLQIARLFLCVNIFVYCADETDYMAATLASI
jgi:hypothetical protein